MSLSSSTFHSLGRTQKVQVAWMRDQGRLLAILIIYSLAEVGTCIIVQNGTVLTSVP